MYHFLGSVNVALHLLTINIRISTVFNLELLKVVDQGIPVDLTFHNELRAVLDGLLQKYFEKEESMLHDNHQQEKFGGIPPIRDGFDILIFTGYENLLVDFAGEEDSVAIHEYRNLS